MSSREEGENSDQGGLRNDFNKLSLNSDYHDPTASSEISKPTRRRSELDPTKIQELQGLETYGLELPQSKSKCTALRTYHDSCQFHDELDCSNGLALPQFRSKRTAYVSHLDSYQIHNLLNPTRGIRDEMARKGIIPRDHHKANVAAIAMRSAKLHNFRNGITGFDLPNGRTSRVRNSRYGVSEVNGREERCEISDNASVVTATTQLSKGKKNYPKIDFMARNIEGLAAAVAAGKKKLRSTVAEQKIAHENYGKVPAYLSQRKLELAQDREQR